jgi:hypothetical protein
MKQQAYPQKHELFPLYAGQQREKYMACYLNRISFFPLYRIAPVSPTS